MAIFNPEIPKISEPDYTRISHGISQPHFESTEGRALAGLGNLIETGIKGSDEVVKAFVRTEERDKLDPLVEQRKNELLSLRNKFASAEGVGTVTDESPETDGRSGSTTKVPGGVGWQQSIPQGLTASLSGLNDVKALRANGKVSETDYLMRRDSILKDIRSHYPVGYRDYIDQYAETVTGIPTANSTIRSITADINTAVTNINAQRNNTISQLEKYFGYDPLVSEWINGVRNGTRTLEGATDYINRIASNEVAMKMVVLAHQATEAGQKDRADSATRLINLEASHKVGQELETFLRLKGVPEDLEERVKWFNSLDAKQKDALVFQLNTRADQLDQGLVQWSQTPLGAGKGSYFDHVGDAGAVSKTIKANTDVMRSLAEGIKQGDATKALMAKSRLDALQDSNTAQMYANKNFGQDMLDLHSVEKAAGPYAMPEIYRSTKLPSKIKAYFNRQRVNAAAGSPDEAGRLPSAKQNLIDNKNLNLPDSITKADLDDAGYSIFANPKLSAEIKQKFVSYYYNPETNRGLVSLTNDPVGTFNKATKPEIATAIKQLGEKYWSMYKDWTQSTWNTEVLKPTVQQMNSIGTRLAPEGSQYRVNYDDKSFSFGIDLMKNGKVVVHNVPNHYASATIDKFNTSITHMSAVLKAEGKSDEAIHAYIFGALKSMALNSGVFGRRMGQAIEATRPKIDTSKPTSGTE